MRSEDMSFFFIEQEEDLWLNGQRSAKELTRGTSREIPERVHGGGR